MSDLRSGLEAHELRPAGGAEVEWAEGLSRPGGDPWHRLGAHDWGWLGQSSWACLVGFGGHGW